MKPLKQISFRRRQKAIKTEQIRTQMHDGMVSRIRELIAELEAPVTVTIPPPMFGESIEVAFTPDPPKASIDIELIEKELARRLISGESLLLPAIGQVYGLTRVAGS